MVTGMLVGVVLTAFFGAYSRILWLSGFNAGYRDARFTIRLD